MLVKVENLKPGASYKIVNALYGTRVLTALPGGLVIGATYDPTNDGQKWEIVGPTSGLWNLKVFDRKIFLAAVEYDPKKLITRIEEFGWDLVDDPSGVRIMVPKLFNSVQLPLHGGGTAVDIASSQSTALGQVWQFEEVADSGSKMTTATLFVGTVINGDGGAEYLSLWDIKTRKHVKDLPALSYQISPQRYGSKLASRELRTGIIRIQDVQANTSSEISGVQIPDIYNYSFIQISTKGSRLLASWGAGSGMFIIDVHSSTPKLLRTSNSPTCGRFSDDDNRLAVGYDNSTLEIWNLQTYTSQVLQMGTPPPRPGHMQITCIAWASDGSLLASRQFDPTIAHWNGSGSRMPDISTGTGPICNNVYTSFLPNSHKFAITGHHNTPHETKKGIAEIWNLDDTSDRITLQDNEDHYPMLQIEVSSDGTAIAGGIYPTPGLHKPAKIWDALTHKRIDDGQKGAWPIGFMQVSSQR